MRFKLVEITKGHLTAHPGGKQDEPPTEIPADAYIDDDEGNSEFRSYEPQDPGPEGFGMEPEPEPEPDFNKLGASLGNIGKNIKNKMLFRLVKNEET